MLDSFHVPLQIHTTSSPTWLHALEARFLWTVLLASLALWLLDLSLVESASWRSGAESGVRAFISFISFLLP